jgi:hypothetical protein
MMSLLGKRHKAFETLLKITGEMEQAVSNGDFDSIEEMAAVRDRIVKEIIDIELPSTLEAEDEGKGPTVEAAELLALIHKISNLNESLIERVSGKLDDVGRELAELNRGAGAVAGYTKISSL